MSELEEQKRFYDDVEEDDIEFIEYDIDEKPETYHDDVAKLSNEAKRKQRKAEFSLKKEIMSWIIMIVVAVGIAAFVSNVVLINAYVPTASMESTIPTKSRMIGLRLAYTFSDPERGDIIIFKSPYNASEDYVKRIIGLPGEKVVLENSQIYVYNGDGTLKVGPLEEPYLKDKVWMHEGEKYTFYVPEESYLVLGDNRNNSRDARTWYNNAMESDGDMDSVYIHKDKILAQALFIYWDSFHIFDDVEY